LKNSLKRLRDVQGLTLAELASASKVAKSSIGHYEKGDQDLSLEKLEKIAEILKTSVEEIRAVPVGFQDAPLEKKSVAQLRLEALEFELQRLADEAPGLDSFEKARAAVRVHEISAEIIAILKLDPEVDKVLAAIFGEAKSPMGFHMPKSILRRCYLAGKKGLPEPFLAAQPEFQKLAKLQATP
jgi:transcriptional regulator with XRE-family HTH domain